MKHHKTTLADSGFSYSRPFFEELVDSALRHANKLGATDAAAEASEACGLSVSVRKGDLENVERNRDKSLSVSVYVGLRRGNANTSDFSDAAIAQTVKAAGLVACHPQPVAGDGCPRQVDLNQGVGRELQTNSIGASGVGHGFGFPEE